MTLPAVGLSCITGSHALSAHVQKYSSMWANLSRHMTDKVVKHGQLVWRSANSCHDTFGSICIMRQRQLAYDTLYAVTSHAEWLVRGTSKKCRVAINRNSRDRLIMIHSAQYDDSASSWTQLHQRFPCSKRTCAETQFNVKQTLAGIWPTSYVNHSQPVGR